MKVFTLCSAAVLVLLSPSLGRAQNTGRIECPRNDGYVYLYSSITTMDVRATLQCGEVIQINGRYDNYYSVRSGKGDTGYVPLASIVLLRDQPGAGLPAPAPPARERTPYDERPRGAPAPARAIVASFTLLNDTPVHVKLTKALSSATAHVGEPVEFEVVEDVFVEGVLVLNKGAKASGVIAAAEPKKHFGRGGRLAFSIKTVGLVDGAGNAALLPGSVRLYQHFVGGCGGPPCFRQRRGDPRGHEIHRARRWRFSAET